MSDKTPKPVLRIERADPKETLEIFLLNPGETFPNFGGGRAALLVRKTASLIFRRTFATGIHETEFDLTEPKVWEFVQRQLDRTAK
jgi:hypothetical protein